MQRELNWINNFEYAKKPQILPVVFTKEEARKILLHLDAKGHKDLVTMLPISVKEQLTRHIDKVKPIHANDMKEGFGRVSLPYAIERKYTNAAIELGWQYVFPASKRTKHPITGIEVRHHIDESVLQKSVKNAIRRAGIHKQASCYTFRYQ